MRRVVLTFAYQLCWGCKTCEVACKQENRPGDGVKLIRVWEDGPGMVAGKLNFVYQINVCRHCDDPPCADACPANAIRKRTDGIVILDKTQCTGCKICIEACPYDAIAFDDQKAIACKCNLCHHRVDAGLMPACADNVCPAHCIRFEIKPNAHRPI
jgi:Fe-S-cluster-containing dehydrogenase component